MYSFSRVKMKWGSIRYRIGGRQSNLDELIGKLNKVKDDIKEVKITLVIRPRTIEKWCNSVLDEILGKYLKKEWKIRRFSADLSDCFLQGLSYSDALTLLHQIRTPLRLESLDVILKNGDILSYWFAGKELKSEYIEKGSEMYKISLDIYKSGGRT